MILSLCFLGASFLKKKKNQTKPKTKKQNIDECLFGKSISEFGCFEKSETLVYHAEYFWYEVIPKTSESKKMWRLLRFRAGISEAWRSQHYNNNSLLFLYYNYTSKGNPS